MRVQGRRLDTFLVTGEGTVVEAAPHTYIRCCALCISWREDGYPGVVCMGLVLCLLRLHLAVLFFIVALPT